MDCYRRVNVNNTTNVKNIMMLHISAMAHARKLKFSIYVHLPSVNKMIQ